MKLKKNNKQKGFSLIELLLAIGIMSIAFIGIISYLSRMAEQTRAEAVGEQISEVGKALSNYINRESGNLLSCLPVNSMIQPADLSFLTQSTGTTVVGACTLNNRQFLPSTFPNVNLFRSGFNVYIRNNASGSLNGLVLTDSPVTDPGAVANTVRYDWIGSAMRKAGAQSGMTFTTSATTLNGLGGGWALNSTEFPAINQLGLLGYRVGYQGTYDDIYLRLDGAYPMRGNLNMGNYNINNATDINFNGWLNGNNALLNNLKTGYISNSGNIQTNTLTATTSIATGGRELNARPTIWSASPNSGDFIHTWNLYSENMIATGSNGNIQASMDKNGIITANNIRLKTAGCAPGDAGRTTGLDATQQALVRGTDCNERATSGTVIGGFDGMLTDRLPKYVSRGAQIVDSTRPETMNVNKPACTSAGGYGSARIIVTPQIQNMYGDYDVQVQLIPQPNNSINVILQRSQYTAEQMQVYAVDNGTTWTVRLNSAVAQKYSTPGNPTPYPVQGFMALAETFCDYGN